MRPKKHLGQNFLKSIKIVERMVSSAQVSKDDVVLEIGPGKGILTKVILETGAKLICVEKDKELLPFLQTKFEKEIQKGQLMLIEGDILEIDLEKIIGGKNFKIIANIPYYITGEIIRRFLSGKFQPTSMTLLVQKEVARRIVANDKKESILSLSVKIFGDPKIVEIVKKTMFTPAPSVDSAVIHISNISNERLMKTNVTELDFFEVIKVAFSQKRKQLLGNLKKFERTTELEKFLVQKNIPRTIRAEDIPIELWFKIVSILKY